MVAKRRGWKGQARGLVRKKGKYGKNIVIGWYSPHNKSL
jgi:hypothetical protein